MLTPLRQTRSWQTLVTAFVLASIVGAQGSTLSFAASTGEQFGPVNPSADGSDDLAASMLERLKAEHPAAYFRQQEALMTDDPVTNLATKKLLDQYSAAVQDRAELQSQTARALSGYVQAGVRVQRLEEYLALLNNDIYEAEIAVRQASQRIASLERQIITRRMNVVQLTDQAGAQELIVRAYVRALETSMSRSALEVLLTSDTFAEAVDQSSSLDAVKQAGSRSISTLRDIQLRLGQERTALENDQRDIAELHASLEEQQSYLLDQRREKGLLLVRTQGQQSIYEQLMLEAQEKQARVERELQDVTDALSTLADPAALEKLGLEPSTPSSGNGPVSAAGFIWPVPPLKITTFFHDPEYAQVFGFPHEGVDIRAAQSSEVRAAADGVVYAAKDHGLGYSFVVLVHRDQRSTVYGHLSKIDVKEGQVVRQGDLIGLSGGAIGGEGSGRYTTGPHLHFETRQGGRAVNPLDVLP